VLGGVDAVKPRGHEPHSRTAAAHSPVGEFSLYNIFVFYFFHEHFVLYVWQD
jgi:hypothetical protein